ncbi:MAG: selenocysteine lyase/cysteine desulfurase [Arenicella sp.]
MSNYQDLFHPSQHGRYLLTHSIGLMPRSTEQALKDNYLDHWRSGAEDIWSHWLDGVNQFNQSLANLLQSQASQFCPQTNVSSGLSKLLMALPEKPGKNVIVATESDFPSAGFVLKQAERLGFALRLIPKTADLQALDTWEQALSADVHTAFITQVHYNTNKLTPVESIAELCRARGITSIVDTAQATGIVPIDLSRSACDILVGSCIKWLCGGPGAGFVWVNAELIEQLKPYDVGWFSHQNPFEFDIHNFEYADDAARFWGGTPSVAPYIAATNSIKLITDIGIKAVVEHNRRLTQRLLDAVPENCIVSPQELNKKGGTTVLKFDNQGKLEDSMRANKLLFDSRQYGMRLSPHIYTNDSDIDCLIDCITQHLR